MRTELWNALLDSEMNVRYWDALIRRLTKRERMVKWLLAGITSGTTASIVYTYGDQTTWRFLAATGALVSLGLALFDTPTQVRGMADLKKAWATFEVDYQGLWLKLEGGMDDSRLLPRFLEVRAREPQHKALEGQFPRDRKLIRRCQVDVLRARGLSKE